METEIHSGIHHPSAVAIRPRNALFAYLGRPVPRFVAEFLGMCAAMCLVGGGLLRGFFETLGYGYLVQAAPALAVVVIVVGLSLPMAVYMVLRGHGLRHNASMTVVTAGVGVIVIGVVSAGVIAPSALTSWRVLYGLICGPACAVMFIQMLRSFDMYSGRAGHDPHAMA